MQDHPYFGMHPCEGNRTGQESDQTSMGKRRKCEVASERQRQRCSALSFDHQIKTSMRKRMWGTM